LRRVVITGLGVVSPIGCGKSDYWKALAEGKNGVNPITLFDTENFSVRIAAEVSGYDPEVYLGKKEVRRSDRVIHFAVGAAEMAIEDSGIDLSKVDPYTFGVYFGSGEGGITTTHENYEILHEKGPSRVSPFFIPMMISNMSAAYLAMRYGAKGPNMSVVTACATANHTMGEAFHAIRRGDADLIISGGGEAAITPIAVAGFAANKTLSTRNDEPSRASRPFDRDRDGFVMGEGAGVLILEELSHAQRRGAHIYAEFTGYGATCDAYHITAPDPSGDGARRAMDIARKQAGWELSEVDLINAHGTSTELNDKMESMAIRNLFGDSTDNLLVHSTKSMVGHALGAAGALEAIAAIQAIEEGIVHPTINLENLDEECRIPVLGETLRGRTVNNILLNNFGFGGHNGVLAIQRYTE